MKSVYIIVLVMLGSLSLPLAGAFARVAPQADVTMQSGESANLTGQAANEQAIEPIRKYRKNSINSSKKSSKKSKNSNKHSKNSNKKSSKSASKIGKH